MASKRSLQQFLDGDEDKGKMVMFEGDDDKGKAVAVEGGDEDKRLQKIDIDSSSESNKEVADEELDPWQRAANEYSPPEDTSKWRPWSAREDLIIFMGACHAREVLRQQMLEGQGIEDEDPVDDRPEVIFEFGTPEDDQEAPDYDAPVADPDTATVDAEENVDPVVPTASNDQATVADLSSDPLPPN